MGLRKIYSFNELWEELVYHQDALHLDPLTADLEESVDPYLARWEEVSGVRRQAQRELLRAQAIFGDTNYRADQGVLDFVWDLRHADRDGTRLKTYLTLAPSRFVRRALGSMAVRVKGWVARVRLEPEEQVKRHAPLLEALANEATGAVEGLAKAQGHLAATRAQVVDDFIDDVNAFRLDLHGELQKRAAANGKKAEWVDKFFRPSDRRRRKDEEEEEVEETPTEPTSPTEPTE